MVFGENCDILDVSGQLKTRLLSWEEQKGWEKELKANIFSCPIGTDGTDGTDRTDRSDLTFQVTCVGQYSQFLRCLNIYIRIWSTSSTFYYRNDNCLFLERNVAAVCPSLLSLISALVDSLGALSFRQAMDFHPFAAVYCLVFHFRYCICSLQCTARVFFFFQAVFSLTFILAHNLCYYSWVRKYAWATFFAFYMYVQKVPARLFESFLCKLDGSACWK